MPTHSLLIGSLIALVACGGGDDAPAIDGMYQTTSQEGVTGACSPVAPIDPMTPYFQIEEQDFFGVPVHTRSDCETADPASCEAGGGLLSEETDDGWRGTVSWSSGDASACVLGWNVDLATIDGDELTFESYEYSDDGAFDPCTPDEAEARGEEMPCVGYELLVGTRVAE